MAAIDLRLDSTVPMLAGIGLVVFGCGMAYASLTGVVRDSGSALGFLTVPIYLMLTGYGLSLSVVGASMLARRRITTAAALGAVLMWPIVPLAASPAIQYGDGSAAWVAAIALVVAALASGVWLRRRSIDGSN